MLDGRLGATEKQGHIVIPQTSNSTAPRRGIFFFFFFKKTPLPCSGAHLKTRLEIHRRAHTAASWLFLLEGETTNML